MHLRAIARRTYRGTAAWQDQALASKRASLSTTMAPVSFDTLRSLYSFRPGIAYVLDALYLAPTARSPAQRTMRSCRGSAFAKKDAGLAPLPASRAAQTTPSGTRVTRTARDSGFEPLPEGAAEPSAAELNDLVREWIEKTGAESVVIQGEGDPLAAADVVCETLMLARGSSARFRLNTLGVGATGDAVVEALKLVDTVSVFLPAPDSTKYYELLQPRDPGAFDDACAFVRRASAVAHVEVTAVDRPDVDVAAVEALAKSLGAAQFRTRSWLGD
mmetsp:Transcript_19853/g.39574  ORF Transcript_19853/g.39574 Transcript_19853/m.39574 type:complete len:274 (+) Transcript_19853:483-1304(+)